MVWINSSGYLEKEVCRKCYRNWWLVKNKQIVLNISIPSYLLGKKLKFKVEVVEQPTKKEE